MAYVWAYISAQLLLIVSCRRALGTFGEFDYASVNITSKVVVVVVIALPTRAVASLHHDPVEWLTSKGWQ